MNYSNGYSQGDAWKGFQQVEGDPIKSTIKLYRRLILHLKKVKDSYLRLKYKEGEESYEKAVMILTELSIQLTNPDEVEGISEEDREILREQVEEMYKTYHYSLMELEFIGVTKNVKNIDQVIQAIKNILEAYTDAIKQLSEGHPPTSQEERKSEER